MANTRTSTRTDDAPPLRKEEFESLAQFRFGIRSYLRFSEETVRSHGVQPQQYQLMLALKGFPGRESASIRDLADALQLRHHSVVGLIDRAQERGLVQRTSDPLDERVVQVSLTVRGQQLLERLSALHHDELKRIGTALAPPVGNQTALIGERLVDNAADAIIYADRDGVIRVWNAGAERIFGYAADQAIGTSLDLIIPEKHRPRHWAGWDRVIETGETKYGTELLAVPGLRADGTRISLEFSIAILRDPTGSVDGFAAILRDVSTRREEDVELRKRLQAAEKRLQELGSPSGTP
jgi:PAS domain S-box-containing protein